MQIEGPLGSSAQSDPVGAEVNAHCQLYPTGTFHAEIGLAVQEKGN